MRQAALIGLGTMGPGIAATLSRGGIAVRAHDAQAPRRERARGALGARLRRAGPARRRRRRRAAQAEVTFCDDLAATVAGADLVIENVPEKVEIKADALPRHRSADRPRRRGRHRHVRHSDHASCRAFISHPERFVGMHWSNPPHIIPMIEVIAGEKTAPATVDCHRRDLIRALGLLPVVVKKDVPGFVENRVLYALLREVVDWSRTA